MPLRNEIETGRVVHQDGGDQSELLADFTRVTYNMIATLAVVLEKGKKYDEPGKPPNWMGIGASHHLNHCIHHIFAYLKDEDMEDIEHAFCRLGMAVHQLRIIKDNELA